MLTPYHLPISAYAGPYLTYVQNPGDLTSLLVWTDWVEETFDDPVVRDTIRAVRLLVTIPPDGSPGVSSFGAVRCLLPPPGVGSTGWDRFPFCESPAACTYWRGQAITVWLSNGLPSRVVGPVEWLDPFHSPSRLWWLLERYPWIEVVPVLRRLIVTTDKDREDVRYGFLHDDRAHIAPHQKLNEGYIPPIVREEYKELGRETWGSVGAAQAAIGSMIKRFCLKRIRESGHTCPATAEV